MSDQKLTIDLRGVGNDIPTRLGKSRPTLTGVADPVSGRCARLQWSIADAEISEVLGLLLAKSELRLLSGDPFHHLQDIRNILSTIIVQQTESMT